MAGDFSDKKVFLVVSADVARAEAWSELIQKNISRATVYTAHDGPSAMDKAINVPPNVLIMDFRLPKISGTRLVETLFAKAPFASMAVVIADNPPEKELYLDEIVTGRVQFLGDASNDVDLVNCIYRALDFAFHGDRAEFNLRFLAAGEPLIREGSKGDFVYFVKKGILRAYRNGDGVKQQELGQINVGEFVGEMAYINGEPRMANVDAVTGCELIEVPIGIFDIILFRRPTWSRALMLTLSRRLRQSNARIS